jgi:thiol:disulfide interchange protein DsbG
MIKIALIFVASVTMGWMLNKSTHAASAGNWPVPIQALQDKGFTILERFDAPGGMTGFAALYQQQPNTLYLTPDGQHVITGILSDAQGKSFRQAALDKLFSHTLWQRLAQSTWIADGRPTAPKILYTFTDPNCPYCHQLWKMARPAVKAGKVQFRHIMVGIIRADSPDKAAALLTASSPPAALMQHEQQIAKGGVQPLRHIPDAVQKQLDANRQLMTDFGVFATPATLYQSKDGTLKTIQGFFSEKMLNKILAS